MNAECFDFPLREMLSLLCIQENLILYGCEVWGCQTHA